MKILINFPAQLSDICLIENVFIVWKSCVENLIPKNRYSVYKYPLVATKPVLRQRICFKIIHLTIYYFYHPGFFKNVYWSKSKMINDYKYQVSKTLKTPIKMFRGRWTFEHRKVFPKLKTDNLLPPSKQNSKLKIITFLRSTSLILFYWLKTKLL